MKILDGRDLANALDIEYRELTYILYNKKVENCYESFNLTKSNGEIRVIDAPNPKLKIIQKKLVKYFNSKSNDTKRGNIAHGFIEGKSIITNANIHKRKKIVLNLDLKDFFATFHFGRVRGYFQRNNRFELPIEVATMIAQLTCYNGCLPQGAPTSPIITNLICEILDYRISKLAKKYRLTYTRYADDMTFSTNDNKFKGSHIHFIEEINELIIKSGFELNQNKTRLSYKDSRQEVTGITVNEKLGVNRKYVKETRAMANRLYKKEIIAIDGKEGNKKQLEGRFSFINQLDKHNNRLSAKKINHRTLNGREREYQKFIFYNNFFMSDKPIIITEGKTDCLYLKSALRKYHIKYPNLIRKSSNGTFEYQVKFLNRTKKLRYFFDISPTGADTWTQFINYYSGTNNFENYFKYFSKFGFDSENPVIFIFDNELGCKKRPVEKFINSKAIKEIWDCDKANELNNQNKVKLNDLWNLFLVVNPLVKEEAACEIEDLFDDEILDVEIGGKKFDKKGNKSIQEYYSKEIFSKYIYDHYEEIEFNNFIPLLNNIDEIVVGYK